MANEPVMLYVGRFNPKQKLAVCAPKTVAKVKMLGGAITFDITDSMEYEIPTEEQRENLKKVFGIDIEVMEE